MLAGNFSVWSTVSSLMVRCQATRRLEAQDRYQDKVSKDEEQNLVKKNHNALASSVWTFQSVSWLLHWPAQRPMTFWCGIIIALLSTFLLVHDPNFLITGLLEAEMMLSTRCWIFKRSLFNSFHSFPQMLLNPVGIVKFKKRYINIYIYIHST